MIDDRSQPAELVLTNAALVLPDRVMHGSLVVADGVIRTVDEGGASVPSAIDCGGDLIVPGLVDLHTDSLEKFVSPRAKVRWDAVLGAIAHDAVTISAGITTVFDSLAVGDGMRSPDRPQTLGPMVEGLSEATAMGSLRADHRLHLRCEVADDMVMDLFSTHVGNPLVRLVSLMDHAPGQRQYPDIDKWREAHRAHYHLSAEAVEAALHRMTEASRTLAPVFTARIAESCRMRGLPLASHDDQTVQHVEMAHAHGVGISEFPTTRDAAERAHALGLKVLMGSPNVVRGGSHSGNVAAATLAEAGTLDILASDYIPSSLLLAVFRIADMPGWDLPRAVRLATLNAADAVGLTDRGSIAIGKRADLVRVRRQGERRLVDAVWTAGRRVY